REQGAGGLPEEGAGAAAEPAAVVLAGFELRLLCVFDAFCGSCHVFCSLSFVQSVRGLRAWLRDLCSDAEGHTEALKQSAGSVVVGRSGDDGDVHSLELFNLGVVDLSEDQLIAETKGIVAAAIKALGRDTAKVADAGKGD